MTEKVIQAIEEMNNMPKYIDGVAHSTDVTRLCDLVKEVYLNHECKSEVKEYLRNNLSAEFANREQVLTDCERFLDIIPRFLDYIHYEG